MKKLAVLSVAGLVALAACGDAPTGVAPDVSPQFAPAAVHGLSAPSVTPSVDGSEVTLTIAWTAAVCQLDVSKKNEYHFSYDIARADVNDPTNWLLLGSVKGADVAAGTATFVDENVPEGEYNYSVVGMNRCGTGKNTSTNHTLAGLAAGVAVGGDGGGGGGGGGEPQACIAPVITDLAANPSTFIHSESSLAVSNSVTFSWNVANLFDCDGATLAQRIVVQKKTGNTWAINTTDLPAIDRNWIAVTVVDDLYQVIRSVANKQDYRFQFQVRAAHTAEPAFVTAWTNVSVGNSGTPAEEL